MTQSPLPSEDVGDDTDTGRSPTEVPALVATIEKGILMFKGYIRNTAMFSALALALVACDQNTQQQDQLGEAERQQNQQWEQEQMNQQQDEQFGATRRQQDEDGAYDEWDDEAAQDQEEESQAGRR